MGTRFKTANNPSTSINPSTFPTETGGRVGTVGAQFGWGTDVGATLAKAMSEYLGASSDTSRMMNLGGGVPTRIGPPRTTTSLPTIFNGTAKVIQKASGLWTATMSFALRPDPIKAIMAQEIVNEEKIIVITPVVTGGGAQITPERAAAKVVSTTATAREFHLARYGIDVIMNLNGAHQPEVWAEELNVKLKAQRKQMDEAWMGIAYQTLMEEGVSIIQAMLRSNPVAGTKSGRARRIAADRMYANMFACMDKDDYPIPAMISALSFAAVNVPVGGAVSAGAALLVPPGTLTTSKYTRHAEMTYNMSGIKLPDNEKGLVVPLNNVRVDNTYNLRIMTHYPPADYTAYDSENPQVRHNELMRPVGISMYYPIDRRCFTETVPQAEVDVLQGIADNNTRKTRLQADYQVNGNKAFRGEYEFGLTNFKTRNYTYFRFTDTELYTHINNSIEAGTGNDAATWTVFPRKGDLRPVATGMATLAAELKANLGIDVSRRHQPELDDAEERDVEFFVLRVHCVLMMLSAIYCNKPGAETGRMMMSAPQTGVSVDRATEELLIPMRMYIGAGVIDKEQLIILNDIQSAGFIHGHGCNLAKTAREYVAATETDDDEYDSATDLVLCCKLRSTPWTDLLNDPLFVRSMVDGPYSDIIAQMSSSAQSEDGAWPDFEGYDKETGGAIKTNTGHSAGVEIPLIPYCGTVVNKEGVKVYENNGHFEGLDDPRYCDRLMQRHRAGPRTF